MRELGAVRGDDDHCRSNTTHRGGLRRVEVVLAQLNDMAIEATAGRTIAR